MLHSLVINFYPGHQGLLMGFFSSSVHFDLVGDCYEYRNFYYAHVTQGIVMSFRAGIVPDVKCVL